jgi:hypothetical protein
LAAGLAVGTLALAAAPIPVAAQAPCAGADALREKKLFTEAKRQYALVLARNAQATCAVDGLAAIDEAEQKAADEKEHNDNRLTGDEVGEAVENFFLGEAWPWIALAFILYGLAVIWRFATESKRVSVRAPKTDEALAGGVVAAANAAGEDTGRAPIKVMVDSDDALSVAGADLGKLLRIPGTGTLPDLVNLSKAIPRRRPDLYVSSAIAGGWAVLSLELRRNLRTKRVRIAIPVGPAEEKDAQTVLGLVGGAWLVAALSDGTDDAPISPEREHPDDAAIGYACFRAGANLHSQGKLDLARACYDAIPDRMGPSEAPVAWMGVRLNEMMALKEEGRWREAYRIATSIGAQPGPVSRRARKAYLLAIMWTDLCYVGRSDEWDSLGFTDDEWNDVERHADAAAKAAAEAAEPLVRSSKPDEVTLGVSMQLVALCHTLSQAERARSSVGDVKRILARGERLDSPRPVYGGAPYYDGACALSISVAKPGLAPGEVAEHKAEAYRLIEQAVAATRESRRPRVRTSLKADPMLGPLQDDKKKFADAIGEPISDTPAHPLVSLLQGLVPQASGDAH